MGKNDLTFGGSPGLHRKKILPVLFPLATAAIGRTRPHDERHSAFFSLRFTARA
jgi:hypothetical protein